MTKVAIVTGGGYGIGRATCRLLAKDGWDIVSFDVNAEHNDQTVAEIRALGSRCDGLVGDVSQPAQAEAACALAETDGRSLKALVNCAAMRHAGTLTDITPEQWIETLGVCLYGTAFFCRAAIVRMKSNGGGSIVNFSSGDATGRKAMVAYASAKAAVEILTRCLAVDHLHDRIRVNAVIPPFTVTGMTEHYGSERLATMDANSPSGHAARPEDIAKIVRFLVSDESAALTAGLYGGVLPTR
jgi:meso-butanediol dehydrogenase/(S,S)-butanediol dehydrogenase/diacetyl reductase